MAKRTRRPRDQLPNCYYEGYMEKRSFNDETSQKLWTALCGNTLFFFNDKKDCDYIEKLDLSGFISVTDETRQDRNLDAARFNLRLKGGNIKFTVPNAEVREFWKGYIQAVAELAVPTSLNLLPGQLHMLKEAVQKEKERKQNSPPSAETSCPSYVTLQADMPACYHNVSRLEAELLLDREVKRGNLLLRPGSDGSSFAVSTRQDLDSPLVKHYRVIRKHDGGFIIDVEPKVTCDTLHDMISYLVTSTDGVLIPLIIEEPYEKKLSYISSDNENGEKSVQQPLQKGPPPSLPSKPPKPVCRKTPSPEPEELPVEECLYLNENWNEEAEETEDSSVNPLPQPEGKTQKIPLMPPTPAPRKFFPSSVSTTKQDVKVKAVTDPDNQLTRATISELKLRLEKNKGKCQ
ncbi:signal-transducing adaptor protein 1-like isoform X1 [Simochromis diagramma]|uniref:signal-transducing adaptor protein 1-like isoform X1 n=1 Tax=Simochromis diagramma TaxID=43689 RepID=UPI001A7ED888|nr:signal-transducing adaptor protein 1-like isoform X1 [Simochromis diagramma]